MFGTIKRSIGFRQYQQFRSYKKNKFDGYWNLILEQPKSKSHEHNNDIASYAIGSPISIENNDQEVYKPVYTIDGEIIPRKPEFPNNCCMSGCAHCVLDIYQEELDEWKNKINNIKERLLKEGKPLPNILIELQSSQPSNSNIDSGMKAFLELEKSLAEK